MLLHAAYMPEAVLLQPNARACHSLSVTKRITATDDETGKRQADSDVVQWTLLSSKILIRLEMNDNNKITRTRSITTSEREQEIQFENNGKTIQANEKYPKLMSTMTGNKQHYSPSPRSLKFILFIPKV